MLKLECFGIRVKMLLQSQLGSTFEQSWLNSYEKSRLSNADSTGDIGVSLDARFPPANENIRTLHCVQDLAA